MSRPFGHLPQDASLDTICGEAGKLFEVLKAKNSRVDFNTAIWYLAEDAIREGFSVLKDMDTKQVASAMGNSISKHIHFSHLPKDASLDTICGEAGKLFAARKAKDLWVDFNTEIWQLAEHAICKGFSVLKDMDTKQVASAMGNSISKHIRSQPPPPPPSRDIGYGRNH